MFPISWEYEKAFHMFASLNNNLGRDMYPFSR